MRKAKFLAMFAAAALLTGVTSCDNNDVVDNSGLAESGKPTYLELNVSFQAPGTYASADPNATETESTVKKVTIFIFDYTTKLLVSKGELLPADFTQSTDGEKDVYNATKKIATTTGTKAVYVGINLPANMDLALGATIEEMKNAAITSSVNDITNTSNGFTMFSAEDKIAELVETGDPAYASHNTVTVPVERLSAKVAVRKHQDLSLATGGGVLSNLQFAIRQSNTEMYRFRNVVDGVRQDPNWDSGVYTYTTSLFETPSATYVNVNEYTVISNKDLAACYAAENTSKNHLERESTYASIKAIFVPDAFTNGAGAGKGSNVGQPAKTFYVVSTNDGVKKYFDVSTEADAYMLLDGVKEMFPVKSDPYVNGECYYNLWLNPNGGYNVIRNAFYKATITNILAPGNPGPGPKNPELPIESPTDLTVTFEILPWNLVEWDTILKP